MQGALSAAAATPRAATNGNGWVTIYVYVGAFQFRSDRSAVLEALIFKGFVFFTEI